ncbi:S-methyl-5-thioribose-1-phosphate isomerase [Petrotoga sp. 9PWA.NaAc.5.4]|uniref:S-methyl-5-thioribose-1-phosphate isomerase n=1 Tax=Petrotoga sp. 9PWA.NaAc.5.4 TaxID=1434328 RepID=UPI000CBEE7D3|nr:S-methyl-5-thioribose-1-phosphate isomerase [Petrotoga sp. 9PWA.NaAc.5.4]PNR93572.1 methylthioribose-1-phosphate isomerase [Petrotoga sp. 9PWA.NaAc.5.4]
MNIIEPIIWNKNDKTLKILNQLKLPNEVEYSTKKTVRDIYYSIKNMELRGAPLIGITAAYGVVIGLYNLSNNESFIKNVENSVNILKDARPTAVNLFWALDRMLGKAKEIEKLLIPFEQKKEILEEEAGKIFREDEEGNIKIGNYFIDNYLIKDGDTILTHCNAGALATSKYGTATSPIYIAKEKGWNIKVYADETRPYLQGSRLTAFELNQAGIEVVLICDNMAGWVMKQGKINTVIVGADRIARNGDVANKIGTYSVAVLAHRHGIPFYVAAPTSTIDIVCESGKTIPIEERNSREVMEFNGQKIAPDGIKIYNPAFDVTPNELITAIVTEKGILTKPYEISIRKIKSQKI